MNAARPKKNLAESILARAELFRRGMLFDGVPTMTPDLQLPAAPGVTPAVSGSPEALPGPPGAAAPPQDPALTNQMVAGAVSGQTPLQSIVAPDQ